MIALLLVTKNECDVLRLNLRHHLSYGIDFVAVADNDSKDDTRAVVEEFGDRARYCRFRDFHTRQSVRLEMLRALMRDTDGAVEWAAIADTDEFFWQPGVDAPGMFCDIAADAVAVNFDAKLFLPTELDDADLPIIAARRYRSASSSSPLHSSYRLGKTFYRVPWLLSLPPDHACNRHEHLCDLVPPDRVVHVGGAHHYMIQSEDQFVEKVVRLIEWVKPPSGRLARLRWQRTPPRQRSLPPWTSPSKREWWAAYQQGGEEGVRSYYRQRYVIARDRIDDLLADGSLTYDDAFAMYAAKAHSAQ